MNDRFDVVVVGGGIIGLAVAYTMLRRHPGLSLAVVEKEAQLASHQTSHNSGVLHAGIYYAPGSLKARLCREGKEALERFCAEHDIPVVQCGKVVVAVDAAEVPRLSDLHARAVANGVPGVEVIGPERLREIEPHAVGARALHSPTTAIVDFRRVALAYAAEVEACGGRILLGRRVTSMTSRADAIVLGTSGGDVLVRNVITCAGLHADRVAALDREGAFDRQGACDLAVVPFRGAYCTLEGAARDLVRGLIYPVPDPAFPFLGVHLTRRIDGAVWAGPSAALAFAREGYRPSGISLHDLAAALSHSGVRSLATHHLRTGLAEMWRGVSARAFARAVQRYVPEIRASDLRPGPAGVRAQAIDRAGHLVDDFAFAGTHRVLHVLNAPSPAATASLAIARMVIQEAETRFRLR